MSSSGSPINDLITKTIGEVEDLINNAGESVSDLLKKTIRLHRQTSVPTSTVPNMGSSSSKPQPSATCSETVTTQSIRKIPPFSVAYGLNGTGKTVLYPIDVAKDVSGKDENLVTVLDLQNYLAFLTSVPTENQTLIFKGAHLQGDALLSNLKIREGAKMMMLGRPRRDPNEEVRKALSTLEDAISAASMEVCEIQMKLEAGASDVEQQQNLTKATQKRLLHINEDFMKLLMKLDAVEIPSDRTEVRATRKALIVRVHQEMENVDKIVEKCRQQQMMVVLADEKNPASSSEMQEEGNVANN